MRGAEIRWLKKALQTYKPAFLQGGGRPAENSKPPIVHSSENLPVSV